MINDYEILFLINEGNEFLIDYLLKKYDPLINQLLYTFNINKNDFPDYFQEAYLVVFNCIKKYNDSKGIFYNYCRMAIRNKILSILKHNSKEIKYYVPDEFNFPECLREDSFNYECNLEEFNELKLIKSMRIKDYAKNNNMSVKDVYNYIYKLKKIIIKKSKINE